MAEVKKKKSNKSTSKKPTEKKVVNKVEKKEPVKENKKTEKKCNKGLLIFIGVVLLMALGFVLNKDHIVYKGLEVHNPEENLDFKTFEEKVLNRSDDKIVFLTLFMDTKTDATLYKAMIEEIVKKYDFPEYYIYYTNVMSKEENARLTEILDGEVNAYPMTFLFKNGKVFDYIWGYQVESSYLEALKEKIDLDKYLIDKK